MAFILSFVVVVVTVWATAANYFMVARDPEAPVDTYLNHLEGGSARQVLAPLLLRQEHGLAQLPSNALYRAAANRPRGHEFVGTRVTGDTAVVSADVHLGDGSTVRRDYTVRRAVSRGPFNDAWQLLERDNAPVTVRLPAAVDALAVNGVPVRPDAGSLTSAAGTTAGAPARAWRFEALPGEYDVALPQHSYLLASEHATAVMSLADPRPTTVDLRFDASPRMWEAVDREIRGTVARCERVLHFDAAHCPVPRELGRAASSTRTAPASSSAPAVQGGIPEGVSNVRWELRSRPALVLEQDEREPLVFHAVRFRPATATVTWLEKGERKKGTAEFGIEVTARSTGAELDTAVQLRSTLTQREKAAGRS
ncbi:hypothetical protein [Kocuria tytonis]|nr:hypothetical protein [Kocuria tytonis]